VAWSPVGDRFATLGADGQLLLWRPGQAQPVGAVQVATAVPRGDLAWAPDGARIAVSVEDTVHLVDVAGAPAKAPQPAQPADLGDIHRLAWAPDGRTYYAGTADRTVRVADGAVVAEVREPLLTAWFSVDVAADGRVATAGRFTGEEVLRVYDAALGAGGPALPLPRGARNTNTVRFSPDGRYLCAAFSGTAAYVWQLDGTGGRLVAGYQGHDGGRDVRGLSWQPGTRRVATLDRTGVVHVWELPA
jgi:hypothetical protein